MFVCVECRKEFVPDKFNASRQIYCSRQCKQRFWHRTRGKELYARRRFQTMSILGNSCVLCKTDDPYVLCLDHIHDDGNKDKETYGDDRARNRWIINNPQEALKRFQVLCHNCNTVKSLFPEEYSRRCGVEQPG